MAENNLINIPVTPSKKRKIDEVSENQSDEGSDEDFLCPICLQLLIEPVVMPCQHELCKLCFTQNVQEANLQCPICRMRISSWARKQARNGTLICQERWDLIKRLFPRKCERRMAGEDDNIEDYTYRRPFKRIISENGAIRSEYEEELKKIRKAREEEIRSSEELIQRLMKEEEIVDSQMQQMIDSDEELAKKLQQQIQSPTQTPLKPSSVKTVVNKGKGKSKPSQGCHTLDKWFSPTSKSSSSHAVKNVFQSSIPTKEKSHSIVRPQDSCTLKQKQEEEDFALALKLQEEFDKEKSSHNDVHRKKGTVDGYLLRESTSSSSS